MMCASGLPNSDALDPRYQRFLDPRLPSWGLTSGNQAELLVNGGRALPAMLEAIEQARHNIDLCMYIFRCDQTGWRFAHALAEKARQGLAVQVLYDAVGCIDAGSDHFRHMREAGVNVRVRNPIIPQHLGRMWRPNNRDHRKILIVDDATAFVGGMNLADEYDGDAQDLRHWRDNAVRLIGPAVERLARLFRRGYRRRWRAGRSRRNHDRPAGRAVAWVHSHRPFDYRGSVFRAYNSLIRQARQYVWLMSSYFVPHRPLVRSLVRAAERGVDVRLILPGHSDVPLARLAGSRWYEHLTRRGVKVYELQDTILHGKAAVADGVAAIMGSANLDNRSFRLNWEVLVTILDESLAGQLNSQFQLDMQRSRLITLEELRHRSLWRRLAEQWAYFWAPFW